MPDKPPIEFRYQSDYEELQLTSVTNFLLFDHTQSAAFNANFISVFSSHLKRFQYFIQKLAGVSMENEDSPFDGRQWVAYINDNRHEWDAICEKELIIKHSDSVNFEFELISNS